MTCHEANVSRLTAGRMVYEVWRRHAGNMTPNQLAALEALRDILPYQPPSTAAPDHAARKAALIEALGREATAEAAIASWRRQLATSHISQSQ
jgi:hypothetical protein